MANALETFRRLYLQEALSHTVKEIPIKVLNDELAKIAPETDLRNLAAVGMRGELVFVVPCLLKHNPRLLGYYRLLLGFSQKEFFNKGRLGRFKGMEETGTVNERTMAEIPDLCSAFAQRASELLAEIDTQNLSPAYLNELTMLTLGPQLRGSNNTKIGKLADRAVFELIQRIVEHAVQKTTTTSLEMINAAGRTVRIAFSADPDIRVTEEVGRSSQRSIVAIEIKGGSDQSNIWNRLGEAEKSHQSAKQKGFVEFWTIYNVPILDLGKAREKSPTTNRFYGLRDLLNPESDASVEFTERLLSAVGIAESK